MKQTPLVTVLINNYNYGRFLSQAIDSALEQTYPNIEIIVVDDGSTDNSREIISRYAGKIRPIFKQNGGQASAFNTGIPTANGEWICFLDSDDYWTNNKVQVVLDAVASAPDAGLAYNLVQPVDSQGNPCGEILPHIYYEGDISAKMERTGGMWPAPPTSALSFRTDLLRQIGPIPEAQFRLCADGYLQYLVPLIATIRVSKNVCTMYRLHGANGLNNTEYISNNRRSLEATLIRYETILAAVNERLQKSGSPRRLSLEKHWGYQRLRYQLQKPGRHSLFQLLLGIGLWPDSRLSMVRLLWKSIRATLQES